MTFISAAHVMSQTTMSSFVEDLISKIMTVKTEKTVMTVETEKTVTIVRQKRQ